MSTPCAAPLKSTTTTSDLIPPPLHPHQALSLRPLPTDILLSSPSLTAQPYKYSCTFCCTTFSPPAHHFPRLPFSSATSPAHNPTPHESDGRILCGPYSTWAFSICICWTCGEPVVRGEERVAFGWCFWHWGCFACLFCSVPLKPPPWTDDERGVELLAPPVCRRCRSSQATACVSRLGACAGVEGRWVGAVVARSEGGDDDDDEGAEEVARAQMAVETDSRSVSSNGSGTLRRITEDGEDAEHETREDPNSVSGTSKRKRIVESGPLPAGKKRREANEIGDALWRGGSVQDEREPVNDEGCSEDIGRLIRADTAENTARTEPPDTRTDDPAPASPPTTPDSALAPSDMIKAHIRSAEPPRPDRTFPSPSDHPDQLPSRMSPPARPTSQGPRTTVPAPSPDATPALANAPPNDPAPAPAPVPTRTPSLLTRLATLFATHLFRGPVPPPKLPLPTTPRCAGCRLPLHPAPSTDPDSSVRGPLNTVFHVACMRCATCERVLRGGTSWFERDAEGAVVVSCRKCWRGRRFEAGWRGEEVDECEMGLGFVG